MAKIVVGIDGSETAKNALRWALEEARAVDDPDVPVEAVAIEGPPGSVLVNAARDADLLVVGSRGLGGFASLLLGSVSQQLAHHAPCPLVIHRPRQ